MCNFKTLTVIFVVLALIVLALSFVAPDPAQWVYYSAFFGMAALWGVQGAIVLGRKVWCDGTKYARNQA